MPACPLRSATLAIGLAVLPATLPAQSRPFAEDWRWAHFSTLTGLPSDGISAIAETPDGTPWVATSAGLAWYDGYRWRAIGPQGAENPEGRSPVVVAEPSGTVIGVVAGRLLRGDTSGLTDLTPSINGHRVLVLAAAPVGDGVLALITSPDSEVRIGLVRGGSFELAPVPTRIFANEATLWYGGPRTAILATPAGMWAWSAGRWTPWLAGGGNGTTAAFSATAAGVMVYASLPPGVGLWEGPLGGPLRRAAGEGAQLAVALAHRDDGEAVAVYQAGEVRYRARDRWESLEFTPPELRDVTVLRFRSNGDLWAGTRHGLFLYRRSSTRWRSVTRYPFPDLRNRVNAIARTRDGTIWLGTGAGVVVIGPGGVQRGLTSAAGVSLGTVTGVAVDSLDNVWLASGSSFVGALRFDGRSWRHFGAADGVPSHVHRIEKDRAGRLWFLGLGGPSGPASGGPYLFDSGRFERWGDSVLAGRRTYSFAEGPDGARWFTVTRSLLRWRDGQWTEWRRPPWMGGVRAFTVATDREGRAWFSSGEGGVGVVGEGDSIVRVTAADGLVDDRVWEIRRGPDDRLWFATTAGLGSFRDGQWARFATEEGLSAPHLWPIVPEHDRVLIGTLGRGFLVLNLDEGETPPRVWVAPPEVRDGAVQLRWQPLPFWGAARQERIPTRFRVDDGPWSPWSTSREAEAAVSAGRHTIEVQALSLLGRLGEPARLPVVVPWPLVLRPLFLVAVLGLLAAAAWLGRGAVLERRANRRRVAALEDQLRQAQKMEAVGQLAGGVAHDFNNVLTAVIGHAELLDKSLPPSLVEARADVREILVTAERGAAMIRKLLMFGRKGHLDIGPVRLESVADDLTDMLARLLPERIRLVVTHRGDVTALADRAALEQVLVNLATNARDAMPAGGELRIEASEQRLDAVEAARSGLEAGGRYACLEVADSGAGMDSETLRHVFEPFFTTKGPGKGTGLGMAMVYSLVRQQRGGIEIRSAPGSGTRVRLYLPLAAAGAVSAPAPAAAAEPEPPSGGRLLVVEDDAAVREATCRILRRSGYTVVTAENGEAALALLRGEREAIDLVVTDVMMPGMSGFALFAAVRSDGLGMPFIFSSGYAEHPDAGPPPEGALFLPKPWTAATLLARVRDVLDPVTPPDQR